MAADRDRMLWWHTFHLECSVGRDINRDDLGSLLGAGEAVGKR